jgi:hypothetical protein
VMVESTRTTLSVIMRGLGRKEWQARSVHSGVMRGLDPRIHDELPRGITLRLPLLNSLMDCRVKPGNDSGEVGARLSGMAGTSPAMTGMGGGR